VNQTFTPAATDAGRGRDLEPLARRFDAFCERHLRVLLLAFSVVYFVAMKVQSHLKPLWYDEMFTYSLAALPVGRMWEAMKAGIEVHPPLSFVLAHVAQKILGPTELATRLPFIAAFLGLLLSVFFIVRRELNAAWGFAAALLLLLTRSEYYATEARSYAIVMFCAAFALLCWQRMIAGQHQWWCLAGILCSTAAGTSAHYFGLLIPFPLALGELYRTWRRRRIDVRFWIAIFAGMSIVFLYLPLIRTTHRYVAHNLNPYRPSLTLQLYLHPMGTLVVLGSVILAALWLQFGFTGSALDRSVGSMGVAVFGLWLIPLFQVILGRFSNSMNPRYTESVVIGGVLLFAFGADRLFGNRQAAGFACFVLIAVAVFTTGVWQYRRARSTPHNPPIVDARGLPDLPIVIDQALLYTPMLHYNPELRNRLYFVTSPEDSLRTMDSDTLDLNMLAERGWLPVNVAERDQFFHKGSHFLLLSSTTPDVWLPAWELDKVNEMGGVAREVKRVGPNDYYFDVSIP
jgi:hypothetical protein